MPDSTRVAYQRIGGAAGVAAPLLAFTCILTAIASYPAFSWTNNALSDLGVVGGVTGPLFNFGLYASGFLALNFAVFGLWNYFAGNVLGRVGAAFFVGAALALISIGVFNESYSPIHYLVSVAFFTLAPIALFILTGAFAIARQRGLAVFSVAVGVAAALPWILQFTFNYVPNVAVPEAASGLAVSAWAIAIGAKMLRATR
jgi:hypothetical membrane protein